jgi:hypothetical protein
LTLNEIMSLGGDIMEAKLVSAAERAPEPEPETSDEKALFEEHLLDRSAADKAKALQQHKADRHELARRRAMMARQRYVMTRLHMRYDAKALPRDIQLQPASEHIEGGIGLPVGPKGALPNGTRVAKVSHYQVRFTSLFTWPHSYQCQSPVRWRWGRRWKSLDTALRKVWLATDLPRQSRDASQLNLLQTAISDLGVAPKVDAPAAVPVTKPAKKPESRLTCSVNQVGGEPRLPSIVAMLAVLLIARGKRR